MTGYFHPMVLARMRAEADAARDYTARVVRPGRGGPDATQGGRIPLGMPLVLGDPIPVRLSLPTPQGVTLAAGGPVPAGTEVAWFAHDLDVRLGDWVRLTPPPDRAALEPVRWVVVTAAPPVGRAGANRSVWVAPPPVGAVAPEG